MPRLFVFGIGGTGIRVMKSLVMLLSMGLRPKDYEIVPLIIDPHKDLNELNQTKSLLRLYSGIHSKLYADVENSEEGFFRTKITTLKSLNSDTGLRDEFEFDERYDDSFRNYLELSKLDQGSTKDFLSLLFSERNLNNSLSKGFKGNPNVGSVVLNDIRETPGFKTFESTFGNDDKIFIISSIFGGTGASGFPLLLRVFRNHPKDVIKESKIGALTIMPYFQLTETSELSEIDSNSFMTKTKSALSYYSRPEFSELYNAIFFLGDPNGQTRPYENNEQDQNNKSHLIEMLGALSLLEFSKMDLIDRGRVYEYCLEGQSHNPVTFANIGNKTREQLANSFVNFFLFSNLNSTLSTRKDMPTYIYLKDMIQNHSTFFDDLRRFCESYFMKWVEEMSENERTFSPLNLNCKDNFSALIKGYEKQEGGWFSEKRDINQLHNYLMKFLDKSVSLKSINEINHYVSSGFNAVREMKVNINS